MEYQITKEEITTTKAYANMEKVFQQMILSHANKKTISNGITVFNATGVIPGSIAGNNRKVLIELIQRKNL